MDCAYSWLCNDPSHRQSPAEPVDSKKPDPGKLGLPFLLRNFDSTTEFENERDAAQQPESIVGGPSTRMSPESNTGERMAFVDPAMLLSNYIDPFLDTYLRLDDVYDDLGSGAPGSPALIVSGDTLEGRLDLLSQELEIYSLRKPKLSGSFQRESFQSLFTSENVRAFVVAFSRKRHYHLPIIHWPTFDILKAPLPLLLSVAMMGAAFSHTPGAENDPAVQVRTFHSISGPYIFSSLQKQIDLNSGIDSLLEYCQAALLMIGLGAWMKDEETRRTFLCKYRPKLTRVIRDHQLAQVEHEDGETWPSFIRKELKIRLASWTFYIDCLATLSTNHPPLLLLSEMCGQSPCIAGIWDAETEEDFLKRRAEAGVTSHRLVDQMSELMSDDWTEAQHLECSQLSPYHLHAMSCAFMPVVFNLHASKFPESHSAALFRALDRWDLLWDSAFKQMPEDQRKWLGVARNSPGLIWLSRRILDAGRGGEAKKWRYFQRIPSYTTADVFEFVRSLDGEQNYPV
ncbi:unnamed protein product [Clonostachys rosea]|uniref:Xylanolytic transcriptional activator regulatory domain-containing protein n=1 Tax=Bionectria ochroleuca TaxID=29856 RepID=A0ABY6UPU6_BIOOC|nr:unnamed protein product [Clonostachys rosea]